jgi:hypothetical protein
MPGRALPRFPLTLPLRPRLARLTAPPALVIAFLLQAYLLTIPISIGACLFAPPGGRAVAVVPAWVAVEWAYLGTYALLAFPNRRGLVEVIWVGWPAGLLVYGLIRRRVKSSHRNTNQSLA